MEDSNYFVAFEEHRGEREGESKGGRESIKEEGEREGVRNLGTISICM